MLQMLDDLATVPHAGMFKCSALAACPFAAVLFFRGTAYAHHSPRHLVHFLQDGAVMDFRKGISRPARNHTGRERQSLRERLHRVE